MAYYYGNDPNGNSSTGNSNSSYSHRHRSNYNTHSSYRPGGRSGSRGQKLAVLIDADSVSPNCVNALFTELASHGELSCKRLYIDSSNIDLDTWQTAINQYALRTVQPYTPIDSPNSCAYTLLIEAMDLLHSGIFSAFCIITSNSDLTGLATRIKESGIPVYGYGETETPDVFRNACTQFAELDTLQTAQTTRPNNFSNSTYNSNSAPAAAHAPASTQKSFTLPPPEEQLPFPQDLICDAIESVCDGDGVALLSAVGLQLRRMKPDFDPKLYGKLSLGSLIQSRSDLFEFSGNAGTLSVCIRNSDGTEDLEEDYDGEEEEYEDDLPESDEQA